MSQVLNTYSPEEIKAILPHLTEDERAEFDSLILGVSSAPTLEAKGWKVWYAEIFGQSFVDALDSAETDDKHHSEAIEWHWNARVALLKGERPPNDYFAYFPIFSRGNLKTTLARRMAVCDACLSVTAGVGGYALVVGGTKKKVGRSASSIEALLRLPSVRQYYPSLTEVKHTMTGSSKGWRADFLNTSAGYVFDFAGLDVGMAGANEEDVRPSFIIPDDVDNRSDSPVIADANFNTFTTEVLPMRQGNTLVFFAQNLINRYSVMYRIHKQQVRVLTNRKPTQIVPAVRDLVTETRTVNGIVKDVFVSGRPTWRGWNAQRIQDEIDTYGLPAFLKECQHAVEQDTEGLVLKPYDDPVHVISRSMFHAKYGTRDIPYKWSKRVFNDWARTNTKYHANVAGILTTSAQNSPLPGCVFLFHAMSFPANSSPEDVAIRLLSCISPTVRAQDGSTFTWAELEKATLRGFRLELLLSNETALIKARRDVLAKVIPKYVQPILKAQHYDDFRGSHEQSKTGALAVYQQVFGLPFKPVNPGGDGGIDLFNLIMRVDYDEDHPFIPDKKGFSNYYVVAEDDRSKGPLYVTPEGIEVYPPTPYNDALTPDDLCDTDRLRYQFKNCRYRDPYLTTAGEKEGEILKLDDDFINGHQFCFYDGVLPAAPLTRRELVHEHIPPHLRVENLPTVENGTGLKPEDELAALLARQEAEKRVKPLRQRFDEWGKRVG